MNDRSIFMNNKHNPISIHELIKTLFITTVTAQKLINISVELVDSGEGDIERNKIILEVKRTYFHMLLNNLLADMQIYTKSCSPEDLFGLVSEYRSDMDIYKDFIKEHEVFMSQYLEKDALNEL